MPTSLRQPLSIVIAIAGMLLACIDSVHASEPGKPRYPERWVYCSTNLQVDRSVQETIDQIHRARNAGYTTMLSADYKLQILDRVPNYYFRNVEKVKQAADRAGIELVPTVFPIGYSNGLLSHDPSLAEGLPVIDQPFVIRRRTDAPGLEAVLDASGSPPIPNGDLEKVRGDRFEGLTFQDNPGVSTFVDRKVAHSGKVSCRIEPAGNGQPRETTNSRLMMRVRVRPATAYRLSCWARTQDLGPAGAFRMLALGTGGRPLTFQEGWLGPNDEWKKIETVFNSLDQTEVNLYLGLWETGPGKLWLDEVRLDEVPLINVLRRPGCPISVRSVDGRRTYREGVDLEPVVDRKLGTVPWPGEYEFDHPGARLLIRSGSKLREGDRLLVSWYHPVITVGSQVMCCLSEPKVEEILLDQARRVNQLFRPRTFFMSHDEIRVANWCRTCRDRGLTPGQLLAENTRRCVRILRSVSPGARIVVWSDMFDPQHNAIDHYYLVNGTLQGSWEGLPKDVIVANWNRGHARESLRFFERRGHRQIIAGYYDAEDLSNFRDWDSAARGMTQVLGFMYTTWFHRYDQLEAYGSAIAGSRQ